MAVDLSFIVSIVILPAELFCFFLIVSLSVNLEFGYAGIPNFGKVLFVAGGGYVAGALAYRLTAYIYATTLHLKGDALAHNAQFIGEIDGYLASNPLQALGVLAFMLGVAAGVAALLGFLSSYPAIRLREDYLGMLLLAAGEFFSIFSIAYTPFLDGSLGIFAPDPIADLGKFVGYSDLFTVGVLALFAILIYVYSERIGRAPLGRTLRALRDNEVASEAVGKDNVSLRRNSLLVGSAIAGIAAVLWLSFIPLMSPGTTSDATFNRVTDTFIPFVIVIIGGAANNRGVLVGTFVYLLIYNAFIQATTYFGPALAGTLGMFGLNNIEFILIGSMVIIILLRRPEGLIPEKATLTMKQSKLREIASSITKRGQAKPESTGESGAPSSTEQSSPPKS